MNDMWNSTRTSERVVAEALRLGATLAGVAPFDAVMAAPSPKTAPLLEPYEGIGTLARDADPTSPPGENSLPCWSVLVLAVAHPREQPELDWWHRGQPGGTPGNQRLIQISRRLRDWIESEWGVETREFSYFTEHGGVYLKDAAVLAGLGCLGKNNLLLTPQWGPQIRLRALGVHHALSPTGPSSFDPCETCDMPCRRACPQGAFDQPIRIERPAAPADLPARTGHYDRLLCGVQMKRDIDHATETAEPGAEMDPSAKTADDDKIFSGRPAPPEGEAAQPTAVPGQGPPVRYCRRCEWACPVGRQGFSA